MTVNKWQEWVNSMFERGEFPEPPGIGEFYDQQQMDLCIKLIDEEVNEELLTNLMRVRGTRMNPEQFTQFIDDVVDSIWVLIWAARAAGVTDLSPFFDEVGRSNNAKIGPQGPIKHPETGKIQKPPGWTAPKLRGLVRRVFGI